MLAALLSQLGGSGGAAGGAGGGGQDHLGTNGQPEPGEAPDAEGASDQQGEYAAGSIPRQLIQLAHQAIALEPDPADKSLLGKILNMLLTYQQRQMQQGQG